MARWNEEQERWMGRGDRYGDDDRRFRAERGEERGWRGRDWREDDRFGEGWRGGERSGERGGEWGERGGSSGERGRARYAEGGEYGRSRWDRDELREPEERGERYAGAGRYSDRDRFGERWRDEGWRDEGGWGEWRGAETGGRRYGGAPYGGAPYGGGSYGGMLGGRERSGSYGMYGAGRGERGTYGSELGGAGWRTEEPRWGGGREGRETRRYGGEEDRGPFERMGERIREGFRSLTGRGPKGYRRSDERIREDVCERIARSGIDAEEVEVKVEKAEVTLAGRVERREDKRMLEDIVEDVFGVEEVHNELRLNRGTQQAQGSALTAGSGTAGTGTTMSAQQQGARTPQQGQGPGRH